MNESPDASPASEALNSPATAGSLLRQARLAKGLHIAALATSIKVAPAKLELLEADRLDELPGAAFTRALAQTVCRALKIDSTPVLALLPRAVDEGLTRIATGLNQPFRDKPGHRVPNELTFLRNPVLLGAVLLALASVLLYLLPAGWTDRSVGGPGAPLVAEVADQAAPALPPESLVPAQPVEPVEPAASAAPAVVEASAQPAVTATSAISAPPATPVAAASTPGVLETAQASVVLVRVRAQSWVEVIDGRGNALLSRLVEAGETIGLDGPPPLRVKIGNASATELSFRGRSVDLAAASRDNVAKLELR